MWVGILAGAGDRAFAAGNDLRYTAEHGRDMVRFAETGFGGLANRTTCWKPIIAAVNGYALGGGFEMALACDIIIAADHAGVGLPEPKVGLMAGAGGVHRLPRMIPQKIAMGYILTGRHMTAQEAHRLGVVNKVVSLADLMPTAMKWAREILDCAPLSIRASKQAALMGLGHPLDLAMRMTYTEVRPADRRWRSMEYDDLQCPQWGRYYPLAHQPILYLLELLLPDRIGSPLPGSGCCRRPASASPARREWHTAP